MGKKSFLVTIIIGGAVLVLQDAVKTYVSKFIDRVDPSGDGLMSYAALVWPWVPTIIGAGAILYGLFSLFWPFKKQDSIETISTYLGLDYSANTEVPVALNQENVHYWYSFKQTHQVDNRILGHVTTVFLVFDKPTTFRQIVASAINGTLPSWEVKSFSSRHAVVYFADEMPRCPVTISLVQ